MMLHKLYYTNIFLSVIILIALSSVLPILSWMTSWLALLLGVIFAIIFKNPYKGKIEKKTNVLLKTSIIAIGFGYPISSITELPNSSFYFIIIFIFLTLIIGYIINRLLKIDSKISYLITSGTSICGASAIIAIASTIKANAKQISISLGTVYILSASGLILFPIIGKYLALTPYQFGMWAGMCIHDTASSIGAAIDFDKYSNQNIAEKVAIVVKLSKVIFIIPMVFLAAFIYKEKDKNFTFPYFIILFILAMLINSKFPNYDGFSMLKEFGKKGLQVSLFLIGSSLSIKSLKTIGIKPLIQGSLLWLAMSISSLIAIILLF